MNLLQKVNNMQQEWQDIETAPNDGTRIIVYAFDQCVREAYYSAPERCWVDACRRNLVWATHWMPLPEPPKKDRLILDTETLTGFHPFRKARIVEDESVTVYQLNMTNLTEWLKRHSIDVINHSVYIFDDKAVYLSNNKVYVGQSTKVIYSY